MCSSTAISGQEATSDARPADHEDTATSRRVDVRELVSEHRAQLIGESSRSSPSVQQTAAERALYPTVRMLGCATGDTNSRGTGSRDARARSLTSRYRSGRSTSLTGRARSAVSTVRSE